MPVGFNFNITYELNLKSVALNLPVFTVDHLLSWMAHSHFDLMHVR